MPFKISHFPIIKYSLSWVYVRLPTAYAQPFSKLAAEGYFPLLRLPSLPDNFHLGGSVINLNTHFT